jgi:hypothetical protein
MSPEIIQIVLPLTFFGICGLVGEILIQGHRDRAAEERMQLLVAGNKKREAKTRNKKLEIRNK